MCKCRATGLAGERICNTSLDHSEHALFVWYLRTVFRNLFTPGLKRQSPASAGWTDYGLLLYLYISIKKLHTAVVPAWPCQGERPAMQPTQPHFYFAVDLQVTRRGQRLVLDNSNNMYDTSRTTCRTLRVVHLKQRTRVAMLISAGTSPGGRCNLRERRSSLYRSFTALKLFFKIPSLSVGSCWPWPGVYEVSDKERPRPLPPLQTICVPTYQRAVYL